MNSYGTNSLANGLNAIANAGENQTPEQPDPKPTARKAESTRQRIRLQAANSARMMRLNSTRSTLSSGGLSRVGTLTASVHGMICEETEFVEPEIAEITDNPQINQMFQTSGHHLSGMSGHQLRRQNREEAQNAGLSQTNQRMSSKDFQRQQQSLPKDDSSDEENDPLSASLSRLRLKQKRQMKENKEQASLRSFGHGRNLSNSKPPDSSWDNLGKAFPTPTKRRQQPVPQDDSSDEENDPLSASLSQLRVKQQRQMKENKEQASHFSMGNGRSLSPSKPPDPSWDNLGTAFPTPTPKYRSLIPQASESTFDYTVSTNGDTDDMSLTEMISQSNLMLPKKKFPQQFTPNSESQPGLRLNQLEQHNNRMQEAAAPSVRSLLWKKQEERLSQQDEEPPQQHSMVFSGKTAVDAERDDMSSNSDDDTTPSSGGKQVKRNQNAINDHYKNMANKMGNHFNQNSPKQDDAQCDDDRTAYDEESSDDDDHQSRATANSAADSRNTEKNARIAKRENLSTNYENVQKSSMLQTIRGNNSMVSNGSMLSNNSSYHSRNSRNSDPSQESMQAKERQNGGKYRRMNSEATQRTENTYRSEGMPPRPRPRPDTPIPRDPPPNSKPTILIVGSTLLDRSIYIQQFPKSGSYHRTAPGSVGSSERAGGSAANTATILNHLRDAMVLQDGQDLNENEDEPAGYAEDELIQIRLATKIGDDEVADKIQNDLEDGGNGGIDLNHPLFIRVEDTTSPLSTHFVSIPSTSSGSETVTNMGPTSIHQPGTCGELTEEDVLNADLDEVFQNVMHLHTDSQHTAAALLLVREARRRGGISVSILANVDRGVMMDELIELSDVIFTDDDASYFTRRLNATTGQLNNGLGVTKNHDSANNLKNLACPQTTTLEDMEVSVTSASVPVHRSYSIKLSDKDLDRICIKTARIAHTFSGKEVIILRGPTRGSLHVRHVKHSERSLNPDRYPPARRHSSLFCQYEQLSEKVDNQASMVLGNVSLRSLKECAAPAAQQSHIRRGSHPPTNQALSMEEDTYRIIRAGTLTNMQQHTSSGLRLLGDTSGANDAYIGGYLLAHLACMGQHDQLHVGTSVELLPLYAMDMNVPNLLLTRLDDERIRFYLLMSTWVAGARIFGNDSCSRVDNGQTSNGGASLSDASARSTSSTLPTGHGDLDERLGTDIVTVKRRLMELIS